MARAITRTGWWRAVCVTAAWAAAAATIPETRGDVVGASGTITEVPGYDNTTRLKYRVGAIPTGDRTAHFWLQLKNEHNFAIDIVVCAMVNLKKERINDTDYSISKTNEVPPRWRCAVAPRGPGMPSYHFGCRRMTVPANSMVDAFDTIATFSESINDANGMSTLGSVYFDLLKDCEVVNCDGLVGADNFLTPSTPEGHSDWANVWASTGDYIDLAGTGLSREDWPSGNWVTKAKDNTLPSPARFEGEVTGAPAGALVDLRLNGEEFGPFVVLPDPENPPCGGAALSFGMDFVVPPGTIDVLDLIEVRVPHSGCGLVSEQSLIRLDGRVVGREGNPFYDPGDFMYGVHVVFVKDTVPPVPEEVRVTQQGSALRVRVEASDATTMPIGAVLVYAVDGGPAEEFPIPYAVPASSPSGDRMIFDGLVMGLPFGVPIDYRVDVLDDLGNRGSSPPGTIVLVAGPIPTVGEWGLIAMGLGVLAAGTVALMRRPRPAPRLAP